ncbi:MAG: cytochrome b/b6 domain-containing protein [Myxococcota bacterium]
MRFVLALTFLAVTAWPASAQEVDPADEEMVDDLFAEGGDEDAEEEAEEEPSEEAGDEGADTGAPEGEPKPVTSAEDCASCHGGIFDARNLAPDVHADQTCLHCHPGRMDPHEAPDLPPDMQALADRLEGVEGMKPKTIAACWKCHDEEVEGWLDSAHGPEGMVEKTGEAPTCLTCHGDPHFMPPAFDDKREAVVQCASCHAFSGEEGKPETNPYVVDTWRDTVHGRLLRLGNDDAAACTDCHGGSHAVRSDQNPRSSIHMDNRAETCGNCHEGASPSFARAVSHEPPKVNHDLWAALVSVFFSILTFGTIGLLLLHVGLDLFRSLRGNGQSHAASAQAPVHRDDEVKRFDIHARMQHWGMMISFTTLVITGWPLKTAAVGQSSGLIEAMGGPQNVALIHRIAGALLIAVAVYHLAYLVVGISQKKIKLTMIPVMKDARDIAGNILYLVGVRKERPRFGRFTYYEKFDYWAVFWGMLIMGGSGLMLWFPVPTSAVLPGETLELARIAHSDEAMLAALAIFLWHFYNVHLRPEIFPMSWVWLTGRISAEALYEEHREEYIARYGDVPPAELGAPRPWHRKAAWSVLGLASVLGIGIGVALADMEELKGSIHELVTPPEPPAETVTPPSPDPPFNPDKVTMPEAYSVQDCLTCHDKDIYDTGGRFPHFYHYDDFFVGEMDKPACTQCHTVEWHDTNAVDRKLCLDCHSEETVDKYEDRPRVEEEIETDDLW